MRRQAAQKLNVSLKPGKPRLDTHFVNPAPGPGLIDQAEPEHQP